MDKMIPSYDDVFGIFVLGGSEIFPTFKGYIGQAAIHRRRVLSSEQVGLIKI